MSKIVVVILIYNHHKPIDIIINLKILTSGFDGSQLMTLFYFWVLTLYDFLENVADVSEVHKNTWTVKSLSISVHI
jgi:hypothetical protein